MMNTLLITQSILIFAAYTGPNSNVNLERVELVEGPSADVARRVEEFPFELAGCAIGAIPFLGSAFAAALLSASMIVSSVSNETSQAMMFLGTVMMIPSIVVFGPCSSAGIVSGHALRAALLGKFNRKTVGFAVPGVVMGAIGSLMIVLGPLAMLTGPQAKTGDQAMALMGAGLVFSVLSVPITYAAISQEKE